MRTYLLEEILSIPTETGDEKLLTDFLVAYCAKHGHDCTVDSTGNVFITKGRPAPGGFYPLVCAHTDSVHRVGQPIKIVLEKGHMYGIDPQLGNHVGCGGDDKCGVFICLELLESQPVLKVALFWGEESYCRGSHAAEPHFFEDVGYCLEFDSPQGDIVSYSCDGQQLFEEHGAFAKIAVPILDSHGMDKWQNHPYTDVAVLKRRFDFTCINLPAGYYHMHTRKEVVNLTDVANAVLAGNKLVTALGQQKYQFVSEKGIIQETDRETTNLVLDYSYGHKS